MARLTGSAGRTEITWSILARDPVTGLLGAAVATRSLAAGGLCLHGKGQAGVLSTQARFNPLYGIDGLVRLSEGLSAPEIVAALSGADAGRDFRQLHVIDCQGRIGQHTGSRCTGWAGHVAGDNVSVAGNMLAGEAVVQATLARYEGSPSLLPGDRLITALDAGEAAGGDKRGRQSAALKLWFTEAYPVLDLRVDDHAAPLSELRRLYEIAKERYLPTIATLATRVNPSGIFEDAERDRIMRQYVPGF